MVVWYSVHVPVLLPLGFIQTLAPPPALYRSRPPGSRTRTGLPPCDSDCEPAVTGSVLIPSPVVPSACQKSSGLEASLYRTLSPPPQYSKVIIHLPSVVWTTLAMPGRPPPISSSPLPMLTVSPVASATGELQLALVPFHVLCAMT